jgi:signal transduction histidine kinase/ActR/RegA family two-component response regulator
MTIIPSSQPASNDPGTMHVNRFSLTFTGATAMLEEPFQQDYVIRHLLHVRIALLMGILMYGLFGILDALILPLAKHITWMIRYALVSPIILVTLAATFIPRLHRFLQPLISLVFAVAGLGIVLMIIIAPEPVNYYYYAGIILVFIFGYSFAYLRFLWASISGLIIVILYEVAAVLTHIPVIEMISNNFFLISANVAGMLVCYAIEYSSRRNYFLLQLLSQEQRKIQEANERLEQRVAERTRELEMSNQQLTREIMERHLAEQERQHLEEQLKQAEKMEAIGKLAAGVAHDLNNILTGLVGYPDILLMELPKQSPLRPTLLIIKQFGEKAAAIVQDMLSLSRQGIAEKKVININVIIDDYLHSPEYRQLRSDHPRVRLDTDLQEDLLNVNGSPVHLSKTLMNLINNAFEANLVAGTVAMSTRNCYLDQPLEAYERIAEGEYVVLRVSDTGVGMDADDMRKIFEPFFTKKKLGRSGTGLGMSLVWSTLKDHGGFIDIRSAEGRGSTFDLYFPVTRQKIAERETLFTLEDCRGTESVLVVDDIAEQRDIAAMMLQKLGYSVQTAASGEEAVEYLTGQKVDILVLDMIMEPGIDGCETYRRILEKHPFQKAIIASGFSESERVREALRLGAGAYVKKPYTLDKIARAIRTELDRQPSLSLEL